MDCPFLDRDGFRHGLFQRQCQALRPRILLWVFPLLALCVGAAEADHGPGTWSSAEPSVVAVLPTWPGYSRPGFGAPDGTAPEGSGFFLHPSLESRPTTYIVTSAHVVEQATRIEIEDHAGRRYNARLAGTDTARDIALLEAETDGTGMVVATRQPPPVGLHACVIGNPFGLGNSFSCGVVSATGRKAGFQQIEDFIQTDAAVNPGASGGVLVDARGRLLGMVNAIFTKEADIDAGVNFAISSDSLLDGLAAISADFCTPDGGDGLSQCP